MNNFMEFRQSQNDRLEDAGVIRYGEHVNSIPKANKSTFRSRIARSLREVLRGSPR